MIKFINQQVVTQDFVNDTNKRIPTGVEYCIFYDNPEQHSTIVKASSISNNLLFILLENEKKIIEHYNLSSKEFKYSSAVLSKIQNKIEGLVKDNFLLYQESREAYKSFINIYATSKLNKIRDAEALEYDKLNFQFGVDTPLFFTIKENVIKKEFQELAEEIKPNELKKK